LNECEHLLNEIEGHAQSPTATPQQLLALLEGMPSSTVDAPRKFSADMITRLDQIAGQNSGSVPVHGRLFAQWLHYAFPHECPLPVVAEHALTPSAWLNGAAIGSVEEREQHIQSTEEMELSGEHTLPEWHEEEILPLTDARRERSSLSAVVRTVMQGAAILFVLKAAYSALQTAVCAHQGTEWKDKKGALPI